MEKKAARPRKPRKPTPPPSPLPGPIPLPSSNGHSSVAPAVAGGVLTADRLVHREVEWIVPGLAPCGRLVLVSGARDSGKSHFFTSLIGHVTGGHMIGHDRERPPCHVLLFSPEEDLECEVQGRLAAVDADLRYVHLGDRPASGKPADRIHLPDRHQQLADIVIASKAQVVIIDPISRIFSCGVQVRQEESAQAVLMPLVELAHYTGASIYYTCHLRKDRSGDALDWVLGAGGWTGIPRFALLLGRDPHQPERRVICWSRCATDAKPPARSFVISGKPGGGRFLLGAPINVRADDLGGQSEDEVDRTSRSQCKAYLRAVLSDGEMSQAQLVSQAQKEGLKIHTLRRAQHDLGVTTHLVGRGGEQHWVWRAPSEWPAD